MKVGELILVVAVVTAVSLIPYAVNIYKLTKCDFSAPYRCEFIHGIGLFPPASFITAWFDSDEKQE